MPRLQLGFIIFLVIILNNDAYAIEFLKNNDSFIFPGNIRDFATKFPGEVFIDQESCKIEQEHECYNLVINKKSTNFLGEKKTNTLNNETITITIKPSTWQGSIMFSDAYLNKADTK